MTSVLKYQLDRGTGVPSRRQMPPGFIIGSMSQLSEKTDSMPPRRNVTEELGRGFLQALNAWRLPALSLHDSAGDTLWLSEGSIGPDEHSVVLAALVGALTMAQAYVLTWMIP